MCAHTQKIIDLLFFQPQLLLSPKVTSGTGVSRVATILAVFSTRALQATGGNAHHCRFQLAKDNSDP